MALVTTVTAAAEWGLCPAFTAVTEMWDRDYHRHIARSRAADSAATEWRTEQEHKKNIDAENYYRTACRLGKKS